MTEYPTDADSAAFARLAAQIETLRAELVPRLDRIEGRLKDVETQTRLTNGRVNGHDVQLARLEEHDHAQAQTEAAVSEANDRWFRRFAWGVGIALTAILAGVGWLIGTLAA